MHKILSEISLRMLIRIFSLIFSSVSRLYSFFLWSQWFCCSWPFPFMPLVFLGCLAIFGCLFIFKVDGLIWSGRCRFPLLRHWWTSFKGWLSASGPESGREGEKRGRKVYGVASPSARGLHSGVLEPPAGSPCAIDVFCVCARGSEFAWVKASLPLALSRGWEGGTRC